MQPVRARRRPDGDLAVTEFTERRAAYFRFLDEFDHETHPDLFQFFGFDFFQDGVIEQFEFAADMRELGFRIAAVWISRRTPDGLEPRTIQAWFRCRFTDVAFFRLGPALETSHERLEEEHVRGRVCYRLSEINSLSEELASLQHQRTEPLASLVVETFPTSRSFELVFGQLSVVPEDLAAWQQMVSSAEHDLWLYERGSEVAALPPAP